MGVGYRGKESHFNFSRDIRYEDRNLSAMLTRLAAHLLLDSAGHTFLSDKEILPSLMKGYLLWASVLGLGHLPSPPVRSPENGKILYVAYKFSCLTWIGHLLG